jgi:hypothetical protein
MFREESQAFRSVWSELYAEVGVFVNQACATHLVRCQSEARCVREKVFFERPFDKISQREV